MDDLVFKNIPAEGFDPQTGFSDRVSNPTPSRSGTVIEALQDELSAPTFDSRLSNPSARAGGDVMSFSGETSRLSNPTPSRRLDVIAEEAVPEVPIKAPIVEEPFSRASNPTPTRRGAKSVSPFDTGMPVTSPSPEPAVADDPYSRASNPTPTRRRGTSTETPGTDTALFGVVPGVDISRASNPTPRRRVGETSVAPQSPDANSVGFVPDETFSRASNPTPTRRGGTVPIISEETPVIGETPSLSFASVTDPYGAGLTEDSRASNPTPTRRIFGSDEAPSDDEYDDSSRLSNISPSSRK